MYASHHIVIGEGPGLGGASPGERLYAVPADALVAPAGGQKPVTLSDTPLALMAVMVAVPAATPRTMPERVTVATDSSEELHVMTVRELLGVSEASR